MFSAVHTPSVRTCTVFALTQSIFIGLFSGKFSKLGRGFYPISITFSGKIKKNSKKIAKMIIMV